MRAVAVLGGVSGIAAAVILDRVAGSFFVEVAIAVVIGVACAALFALVAVVAARLRG